jgi:hypothetical protein
MGKGTLSAVGISFAVILFAFVVSAPAMASGAETAAAGKAGGEWVKTELYLGRKTAAGYEVSKEQFVEFLESVVTKYFPKGLTLYEAYGQMQEPDKTISKEATWVIVLVHEKTAENDKAVETVISDYREKFQAREAMVTASPIEARFYTEK